MRLTGAVTRPLLAPDVSAVHAEGEAHERVGRRGEARDLYEATLFGGAALSACEAALLLRLVARTYLHDADLSAAAECARVALAVAELCEDRAALGHATNILAIVEWKYGNVEEAERLYRRAREYADEAKDDRLVAMTASNLGIIADVRGDEREARSAFEHSLDVARRAGCTELVVAALCNLGQLEMQALDYARAGTHFTEARAMSAVVREPGMLLTVELLLTRLRIREGDLAGARAHCEHVRAIADQVGDVREGADVEYVFGLVARATGDLDAAEQHLTAAERISAERHDLIVEGEAACELAELFRAQGRNRQTLQRLNQAHRLFGQLRARRELADVDRCTHALEDQFLEVARKWGESIESKDVYTQGHCVRVANLACALWQRVHGDDTSLFWFRIGALLHDVGKLTVPAEVLNKSGSLTREEWELMREHTTAGVALLADVEFPWEVRPLVESHHERWDGGGYPHGLAGESIPLTARVLGVADVYDALTSERSYKVALTREEALAEMGKDAGTQFDPALFAEFVAMLREEEGTLALVA